MPWYSGGGGGHILSIVISEKSKKMRRKHVGKLRVYSSHRHYGEDRGTDTDRAVYMYIYISVISGAYEPPKAGKGASNYAL